VHWDYFQHQREIKRGLKLLITKQAPK